MHWPQSRELGAQESFQRAGMWNMELPLR